MEAPRGGERGWAWRPRVGTVVPVLTDVPVAVWAGEDGAEPEEEEVEEEEEESGNLDEEELKKMQSDEVCRGQPRTPLAVPRAESSRSWHGATSLGCPPFLHPPLSSLGHSRPRGDSL